jgi:hypothetical protein
VTRTEPSPLLLRGVIVALLIEHVALSIAPVDLLTPIDPHHIGQLMLHGHLPYRDFLFEYPPLAALSFILPGLVPHSLALPVLAVQATVAEIVVAVAVLRHHVGALVRYALLSLLVFPFLSGGFDSLTMVAIAVSTALLAEGSAAGWWVAAWGAMTKVAPASAWVWARRPWRTAVGALVLTLAVSLAPIALAAHPNDSYTGYTMHRGIEVESVAASTTWLVHRIEGKRVRVVYRYRSNELPGADSAAKVWLAVTVIALLALALRSGWDGHPDPWLASFVALLLLMIGYKVLSPQYIAWAAPLAAVLGGRWWRAWMVVAGITAAIYALSLTSTELLALTLARNVVLVGTAGAGLHALLRQPASQRRVPATRP